MEILDLIDLVFLTKDHPMSYNLSKKIPSQKKQIIMFIYYFFSKTVNSTWFMPYFIVFYRLFCIDRYRVTTWIATTKPNQKGSFRLLCQQIFSLYRRYIPMKPTIHNKHI